MIANNSINTPIVVIMTKKYKYGFDYKGFQFGWKSKELYRLLTSKNKRSYPLKKHKL